jgi:methionyl-tRNA synthetase
MALGQPLPKQVFGHPWFLAGEDQKMSKSKGNTIYADDIVNYFGVDAVRFYLLSEMPYAQDGVITYSNVMSRYNSELANTLGNLVSRTLAMCNKYFDGVIPAPGEDEDFDIELKKSALEAVNGVKNKMTEYRVSEAIDELFNLLRRSNKYIDETMPWSLAKTDQGKQRLKSVIYNLLEAIRISAVLLQPFMTITSDKILGMLNTSAKDWQSVQNFGGLEAGVKLGEAQMLFARIDEEKMAERISADISSKAPQKQVPQDVKQQISIDEFSKIELRTAQVIECEPVPKSDKLLKLQLDLGYETRQVVSGIAKFYKPQDLIGKKVVMCANLAPVKLRGVESFGMILASGQDDVRVLFVDDDTPNGSSIH